MGDFFMFQSNKLKNHRPTCSFLELRSSMLLLIMFICKNCISFKINFRLCVLIFKRFAKPLNNADFFFFNLEKLSEMFDILHCLTVFITHHEFEVYELKKIIENHQNATYSRSLFVLLNTLPREK